MSTVQDLLLTIRDSLDDSSKDRWADDNLIRRLNEAQKIINRKSKFLRYSTSFEVFSGQSTYSLPSEVNSISRVLYNNVPLSLMSHESMDFRYGTDWETKEGVPKFAVTNKMEKGLIKISPIPVFEDSDLLDMENSNLLGVYYIKNTTPLTALTDELELDDMFDMALKHYVVGSALRDDMDSQNRALGNEELALYKEELAELIKAVSEDFTSNIAYYETPYRSIT